MIRSALLLLICGLLFASCNNDKPTSTTATTTDPAVENMEDPGVINMEDPGETPQAVVSDAAVDSSPLGTIKASLKSTLSGAMVESTSLENGKLTIKYFPNAAAYTKISPGGNMDDNMFIEYWKNGSRAEKVITLVPAQMLHNFSYVEEVNAMISTGKTTLSISMTRDKITDFSGKSWEELKKMWSQFFRKDIMMNPEKRKAFYSKHVKSS